MAAYYADHETAVSIVAALFALNAVLLTLAAAGSFTRLRSWKDRTRGWSTVGMIGILFIALIFARVAAASSRWSTRRAAPPSKACECCYLGFLAFACWLLFLFSYGLRLLRPAPIPRSQAALV